MSLGPPIPLLLGWPALPWPGLAPHASIGDSNWKIDGWDGVSLQLLYVTNRLDVATFDLFHHFVPG